MQLRLRKQVVFKDATGPFVAKTRPMEVFARELLRQMRIVAVFAAMAVAGQEKLTQILHQVNRWFALALFLLLFECALFVQETLCVVRQKRLMLLRVS
jgi:hypothetical protein